MSARPKHSPVPVTLAVLSQMHLKLRSKTPPTPRHDARLHPTVAGWGQQQATPPPQRVPPETLYHKVRPARPSLGPGTE